MYVTLYHGTTYMACRSIIRDKKISVTKDELSPYVELGSLKTVNGYVYLTNNPFTALDFGYRNWSTRYLGIGMILSVFEIKVGLDEIEIDPVEQDDGKVKCYRLKRDIKVDEITKVSLFSFYSFDSLCKYTKKHEFEKIKWFLSIEDVSYNSDKVNGDRF